VANLLAGGLGRTFIAQSKPLDEVHIVLTSPTLLCWFAMVGDV